MCEHNIISYFTISVIIAILLKGLKFPDDYQITSSRAEVFLIQLPSLQRGLFGCEYILGLSDFVVISTHRSNIHKYYFIFHSFGGVVIATLPKRCRFADKYQKLISKL